MKRKEHDAFARKQDKQFSNELSIASKSTSKHENRLPLFEQRREKMKRTVFGSKDKRLFFIAGDIIQYFNCNEQTFWMVAAQEATLLKMVKMD